MKKIIIALVLILFTMNCGQAKEKTLEQKINENCSTLLKIYEQNKSIDNQISATECVYKCLKSNKQNTLLTAEDLFYLYGVKYNNSANNSDYLNKMYKYAFIALKSGTKDKNIIEAAVWLAVSKNDISKIDYAYEVMYREMPAKAAQIKDTIVTAKSEINKSKQLNTENLLDVLTVHKDELTGEIMTNNEIKARNNAIITNGGNIQDLYMQKKQTDALQNINKNTANINQNLQSINGSLHGLDWTLKGLKYGF